MKTKISSLFPSKTQQKQQKNLSQSIVTQSTHQKVYSPVQT